METINEKSEFCANQIWYEKANINRLDYGMAPASRNRIERLYINYNFHIPWGHILRFLVIHWITVEYILLVFILHVPSHSMLGRRLCCPAGWGRTTSSKSWQRSLLSTNAWNSGQLHSEISRLWFPRASRVHPLGRTVYQKKKKKKRRNGINMSCSES